MKFSKYSSLKEGGSKVTIGSQASISSNSSSSVSSGSSEEVNLNRMLWGNHDDGGDLDETLFVNGSIYLSGFSSDENEEDDDNKEKKEKEYYSEEDDEGGNLYGNKVKVQEIEAQNIKVGNHLYIRYSHPAHADNERCVGEILSDHETNITNNTTEINSLKTRVSTAENNIINNTSEISVLKSQVATNITNITNNTNEINSLKTSNLTEDKIKGWINEAMNPRGSFYHPVIVYSGILRRNSDFYIVDGFTLENVSVSITEIKEGLLTLTLTNTTEKDGYVYVGSVQVTQNLSYQTDNLDNNSVWGRSAGAHWFQAQHVIQRNKTTIYIREFHQGNGNNDSWESTSWFHDNALYAVNVTICGYLHIIPM